MGLTDLFKILFGSNDQKNTKDYPMPDAKAGAEPVSDAAQEESTVQSTADKLMLEFLQTQGFQPHVESNGDIVFKYQMVTFIYFASHDDDSFFRLALPSIQEFSEETRPVILAAANKLTCMAKCAKVLVMDDDVWISVEALLDSTPKLEDFVPRMMDLLLGIRQAFYKELS